MALVPWIPPRVPAAGLIRKPAENSRKKADGMPATQAKNQAKQARKKNRKFSETAPKTEPEAKQKTIQNPYNTSVMIQNKNLG